MKHDMKKLFMFFFMCLAQPYFLYAAAIGKKQRSASYAHAASRQAASPAAGGAVLSCLVALPVTTPASSVQMEPLHVVDEDSKAVEIVTEAFAGSTPFGESDPDCSMQAAQTNVARSVVQRSGLFNPDAQPFVPGKRKQSNSVVRQLVPSNHPSPQPGISSMQLLDHMPANPSNFRWVRDFQYGCLVLRHKKTGVIYYTPENTPEMLVRNQVDDISESAVSTPETNTSTRVRPALLINPDEYMWIKDQNKNYLLMHRNTATAYKPERFGYTINKQFNLCSINSTQRVVPSLLGYIHPSGEIPSMTVNKYAEDREDFEDNNAEFARLLNAEPLHDSDDSDISDEEFEDEVHERLCEAERSVGRLPAKRSLELKQRYVRGIKPEDAALGEIVIPDEEIVEHRDKRIRSTKAFDVIIDEHPVSLRRREILQQQLRQQQAEQEARQQELERQEELEKLKRQAKKERKQRTREEQKTVAERKQDALEKKAQVISEKLLEHVQAHSASGPLQISEKSRNKMSACLEEMVHMQESKAPATQEIIEKLKSLEQRFTALVVQMQKEDAQACAQSRTKTQPASAKGRRRRGNQAAGSSDPSEDELLAQGAKIAAEEAVVIAAGQAAKIQQIQREWGLDSIENRPEEVDALYKKIMNERVLPSQRYSRKKKIINSLLPATDLVVKMRKHAQKWASLLHNVCTTLQKGKTLPVVMDQQMTIYFNNWQAMMNEYNPKGIKPLLTIHHLIYCYSAEELQVFNNLVLWLGHVAQCEEENHNNAEFFDGLRKIYRAFGLDELAANILKDLEGLEN